MDQAPSGPRQRFAVLDGLRALAALAVVADHVVTPTIRALTTQRALAVDFFFVLSGFVVMHAYGARIARLGGMHPLDFMRVRFIRFWPMLAAAMALAIAIAFLRDPAAYSALQWGASAALGLAFLPTPQQLSLHPWTPYPLVGPSYSMFFELFANAVFAFLLGIRRGSGAMLAVLVAASAAAFAWVIFNYGGAGAGWRYEDFLGGFPRVMFSFFAGVLIYRIWATRPVPAMPAWAAFAALLAALCMPATGVWEAPYQVFATMIAFPLIVLFGAGAAVHGAWERIMLRLGALSYGFYLLHAPLYEFMAAAAGKLGFAPERLDVLMYAAVVGVALTLTVLLERRYEAPFRRWLSRMLPRATPVLRPQDI